MILENIPRISAPSVDEFTRRYVWPREPVIITGLYAGQRLSRILTVEDARQQLARSRLFVGRNHYDGFGTVRYKHACSFTRYCDLVADDPAMDLACVEQEPPGALTKCFRVPPYARIHAHDPIRRYLFVGNQGHFTSLHFDSDYRHVLLTQTFGRKRMVLIPPRLSPRLTPVANLSPIALQRMGEDEKERFLRHNDAYDGTLHPGETLFIPKLWWHYAEYTDFSMSVNVGFGRPPLDRMLSALPMQYRLQNISLSLVDEEGARLRHPEELDRIVATYYARARNPLARYERVLDVYRDIYRRICTDALQSEYVGPSFDPERVLGRTTIGVQYDPTPFERSTPQDTLTSRQLGLLRRWRRQRPTLLRRVMTLLCPGVKEIGRLSELDAAKLLLVHHGYAWA